MYELPITKKEYENAVITSDFLSLFKEKAKNENHITNLLFKPQTDGYLITFLYDEIPSYIILTTQKNFFNIKISVKCKLGEKKEQKFVSKNKDTNQLIINKIFESITTTSGK